MRGVVLFGVACGVGACSTPEDPRTPSLPVGEVVGSLPPGAELARLSLDLRGVRPSLDELRAVAEDPDALAEYREEWLDDPRFAARMAWLWNDHFQIAVWPDDYEWIGNMNALA
jgi:hypothetical protein